jgi:hypothetical protein
MCVCVILVHINYTYNLESSKACIIMGKICNGWGGFRKSTSVPPPPFFQYVTVLGSLQISQCKRYRDLNILNVIIII